MRDSNGSWGATGGQAGSSSTHQELSPSETTNISKPLNKITHLPLYCTIQCKSFRQNTFFSKTCFQDGSPFLAKRKYQYFQTQCLLNTLQNNTFTVKIKTFRFSEMALLDKYIFVEQNNRNVYWKFFCTYYQCLSRSPLHHREGPEDQPYTDDTSEKTKFSLV